MHQERELVQDNRECRFHGSLWTESLGQETPKSYFFLLPGDKPVQLRTSCDCTMDVVLQTFLIPTYNLHPVVTYRGVLVEPHLLLSQFEDKALFILVDGPVPDYLLGHQGKLWQCLDCGMATNDNQNLPRI